MTSQKKPRAKGQGSSSRKTTVTSLSFLLEIGTEEIPTTFFPQTLEDFAVLGQQLFRDCRLNYHRVRTVGTCRRLALLVDGVQAQQASLTQEIVGPPQSAAFDASGMPTKAAQGFAKSQGVSVDQLTIKETPKGLYLVVEKHERGKSAQQVLTSSLPAYLAKLVFSKAMRWNASQAKFARPIRWIVALLGNHVLKIEFAGIRSGEVTWGHRYFRIKGKKARQNVPLTNAATYVAAMKKIGVLVDHDERRVQIQQQIDSLAISAKGQIDPVFREELIEEAVWGVEYPHAILGTFQKEFLGLPKPVLISSMKEHQGFFSLVGKNDQPLPKFVAVTNTPWGNTALITKGNERVLSARLKDAQYFFQEDEKLPLHERVSRLDGVMFHHKLGTMRQKVERMRDLVGWMAMTLGREDLKEVSQRAALLSKADLTTGMVGEFPSLQGVMGEEYARHDGELPEVCRAIGEHYLPRFPEDQLPASLPGMLVACADRCDSIAAFFMVGMVPSGSEDPLGLRRAAYGLVRILGETPLRLNVVEVVDQIRQILTKQGVGQSELKTTTEIMGFIIDRLRFYGRHTMRLRDDVMEAVIRVSSSEFCYVDDLLARMQAIQEMIHEPDFETLMVGFKRAYRIVEKEDKPKGNLIPRLLKHPAEKLLFQVVHDVEEKVKGFLSPQQQDYGKVLHALLQVKGPIDNFFNEVLVNDSDSHIRANRLILLAKIKVLFLAVANFSYIQSTGAEAV